MGKGARRPQQRQSAPCVEHVLGSLAFRRVAISAPCGTHISIVRLCFSLLLKIRCRRCRQSHRHIHTEYKYAITTVACGVKVERRHILRDNSQYIKPYRRPEKLRIGLAPVPRFAAPRSPYHHSMRTLLKARQRLREIEGNNSVSETSFYVIIFASARVRDHLSD